MADNSKIFRKYRFKDGELALLGNKLMIAMNRDLTEHEFYGVTNNSINELSELINDFQALPNDEILRYDWSYEIEKKESAKNSILIILRSVSLRAKSVFGANSAKYRSMNPGNISLMNDNNLLAASRQVFDAVENNAVELGEVGISAGYILNFNSAIESFATAIDKIVEKKNIRDESRDIRIKKGNELYALINKYCGYGKLIWSDVSPAKYNDYIIYPNQKPRKKEIPV